MRIIARIIWVVGVICYAVAVWPRMRWGDPTPRIEDAIAILLIGGVAVLAWWPKARPSTGEKILTHRYQPAGDSGEAPRQAAKPINYV